MKRRLAAILAADVIGYSRLIRADEEGTVDRLSGIRPSSVFCPTAGAEFVWRGGDELS